MPRADMAGITSIQACRNSQACRRLEVISNSAREPRSLSRLQERAGERVSPQRDNPQAERTLTRRFAPTSPASGRGEDNSHLHSAVELQAIDNLVDHLALGAHCDADKVEVGTRDCLHGFAIGSIVRGL